MSRLCRLKTKSHGEDGQWAYEEIVKLRKERDELLAVFNKFMDSHEECTDFDGFTAQIVSMDDYHEAQEAIASVKGILKLTPSQPNFTRGRSHWLAALS